MFNPISAVTSVLPGAGGGGGGNAPRRATLAERTSPQFVPAGSRGFVPSAPSPFGMGAPIHAAAITEENPETAAVMAAVELWTRDPAGKWIQRTDAVRLYPRPLYMQYRAETVQAIQSMRPAILKLWTLDPGTGKWTIEVHNAP